MAENINQLIQGAVSQGVLSNESAHALSVPDVGKMIQEALGVNVDEVQASEVVLVTMMVDDSGSIRFGSKAQDVRDGHNAVLEALVEAKLADNILVHCRYLNGFILYPYCFLKDAIKMTSANYDPNKGTSLYDQCKILLGGVVVKAQSFLKQGVPVRTVTAVITDGADEHSPKTFGGKGTTAADINKIVTGMLMAENHIIAGMGIDNGASLDFKAVFKEMGIRDEWILTPGSSKKDIRAAFQTLSGSAVSVSQSAQSFSTALGGGFNTLPAGK